MGILWEGRTHDQVRYGRVNGEIVIEIHTLDTHRHVLPNPEVYAVRVLGRELPERYRYVTDAKLAAQALYEAAT